MDQIMTPYPKTPLRQEMPKDDRIANLSDFRWYDGHFSNVRTQQLTPQELNFVRWKIRREIIGMWRATKRTGSSSRDTPTFGSLASAISCG